MSYEEYIAAVDPLRHSGNWPAVLDLADKYFVESRAGASLVHLCEALIHTRQIDRFRKRFSDLRQLAPDSPDIARLEALCARVQRRPIGRPAEEPQSFDAYLSSIEPLRAEARWWRVRPLAQARFEAEGESASLVHLCEALLHTGDRDALPGALDKLRILEPDSADVLRLDAQYHNAIEDFDGAIALWKKVALHFPEDAEPYARMVQILLQQEQYAPLARLLASLPETIAFRTADAVSLAQFDQISTILFQAGRFELLARVLDAFAGTPFETPKAIRLRAILASRLERWKDAARDWARVVANNPDDGWACLNAINAQIHCSEFDSARQSLATFLQSGRAEAIGALPDAASCAIRLGEVETAQAVLEDRSFRPEDLRQHQRMQLARVFALSGRADDALAFYGKKQDLPPLTDDNLALIVDPGLTITSGHHLNYTLFCWDLFQKLIGDGQPLTPLLLCGGGVPLPAEVKALNVRPELVFEPYAYEEVPTVHRYLRSLNECVYRDLSRPEIAGRVNLVMVHSMRAVMVEGFSRWAADVFREQPGVAVVGLIEVDHLAESPEVIRFYEDIYREGLSRLAAHPNIRLLVYVETRMGKEFLERLGIAGMEVKLYPYLAASLSAKYCAPLGEGFLERPICLGAVGGTRQDRGSWIFPRLIANTQDLAGSCRWKLQLDRQKLSTMLSEADAPLLERLSASPNVSIVDQTLTSAGYYELLDQIDVVILPYQDRYSVSGSGVLYEAVYMGKYLLVPSRTFMPEELARLGHPHRVFEEPTLASIEEQVRWVVQNQAQVKRELTTLRQGKPHALPAEEFYRSIAHALHGI